MEKQIAIDQTYTLWDENNLKIVIPLTEISSKWWGIGIRWCTAAVYIIIFQCTR